MTGSRRLLAVCVLAYPRFRRSRDRDYLLDLASELAEESGALLQGFSLVRGGLGERARGLRRGRAIVIGGLAAGVLVVGGVATAAPGSVDVEVQTCARQDCEVAETWAAARERDGWTCDRTSSGREESWRCTRR